MKLNSLFLGIFLIVSSVVADDFQTKFNYFGNFSASSLNTKGYSLVSYNNDDIIDKINYEPYSKIGIQTTIYNNNFMFLGQIVSHRQYDKFENELHWLNAKYKINDNFFIRVGRMQSPVFLNADSLDIDYIHLWAKAPTIVYTLMALRSIDGIEFLYNKIIGDYYLNVEIIPDGKIKETIDDLIEPTTLYLKDAKIISTSLSNNNFELKVVYSESIINMALNNKNLLALMGGLKAYGNDVSKYNFTNKKMKVLTFAGTYNYKNYFSIFEIAYRKSKTLYPNALAYYGILGYRYNNFTPYIMYAENKNDKKHFNLNHIIDPTGGILKTGLEQLLYKTNSSQKTVTLGLRYDIKKGIALKLQLDRMTTTDYGRLFDDIKREGYFHREIGIKNKAVYQGTIAISFAF